MTEATKDYLAKGTAVLGFKSYIISKKGEAFFDTLWAEAGFQSPLILASSWFDMNKYSKMLSKAAKSLALSERQLTINMGLFQTENDLNGVYKFLMRTGGPRIMISAIPRLAKSYSNFSNMSVLRNETGLVHLQVATPARLFNFASWSAEGAATSILFICKEPIKSFKALTKEQYTEEGISHERGVFEILY